MKVNHPMKNQRHFFFIIAALLTVVILFGIFAISYIQRFDKTLQAENRVMMAEVADNKDGSEGYAEFPADHRKYLPRDSRRKEKCLSY